MGAPTPKQYLPLAGRALAEHTLEVLLGVAGIEEIVVAIAAEDTHWPGLNPGIRARVLTATGGATRAQSVLNALGGFSRLPGDDDWVLVHDMARPCVRSADIERLIAALANDAVGGLLALPVVDTLKRADVQRRVQATVERERLWRAQTPQMFRFGLLRRALLAAREAGVEATDEAMAVERLGYRPLLVEGGEHNVKVTVPADLALAEFHLGATG
jgi:2-C-methyl-D-erythritol 4-phosphate cytidylyltransferase